MPSGSTRGLSKGYNISFPNNPRYNVSADALNAPIQITGDTDWLMNRLINLADPRNAQDAATRAFVEARVAAAANVGIYDSTPEDATGTDGQIALVAATGAVLQKKDAVSNFGDYPDASRNAGNYIRFTQVGNTLGATRIKIEFVVVSTAPSITLHRLSPLGGPVFDLIRVRLNDGATSLQDLANLFADHSPPLPDVPVRTLVSWQIFGNPASTRHYAETITLEGAHEARWERKWPARTDGQLVVGNAAGDLVSMAAGTDGHVITMVNGKPAYAALPGALPAFAGAGRILAINAANNAAEWIVARMLPAGGAAGQVPQIGAGGVVGWATLRTLPAGGSAGQYPRVAADGTSIEFGALPAAASPLPAFAGAGRFLATNAANNAAEWIVARLLPAGGSAGQYVRIGSDGSTIEFGSLPAPPIGLPPGGSEGQIVKRTRTGYVWASDQTGTGGTSLPAFAGAGRILAINAANNAAEWIVANVVPTGGSTGQILTKTASSYGWADGYSLPANRTIRHGTDLPDPAVDGQLFLDTDNGVIYEGVPERLKHTLVVTDGPKTATIDFVPGPSAPGPITITLTADPQVGNDGRYSVNTSSHSIDFTFRAGTTTVQNLLDNWGDVWIDPTVTGDATARLQASDAGTVISAAEAVPAWKHVSVSELFRDLNVGANKLVFTPLTGSVPAPGADTLDVYAIGNSLYLKTLTSTRRLDLGVYQSAVAGTLASAMAANPQANDLAFNTADAQMWIRDASQWHRLQFIPGGGSVGQVIKRLANNRLGWANDTAGTGGITSIPTTISNMVRIGFNNGSLLRTSGNDLFISATTRTAQRLVLAAGAAAVIKFLFGATETITMSPQGIDMHATSMRRLYALIDNDGYPGLRLDYDRSPVATTSTEQAHPAASGSHGMLDISPTAQASAVGIEIPTDSAAEGLVPAGIRARASRSINATGSAYAIVYDGNGTERFRSAAVDVSSWPQDVATAATPAVTFTFDTRMVLVGGDTVRLEYVPTSGASSTLRFYGNTVASAPWPLQYWNSVGANTEHDDASLWFELSLHKGRTALHLMDHASGILLEPHPDYSPPEANVVIQALDRGHIRLGSAVEVAQTPITYAASIEVDFVANAPAHTIALTGNLTISGSRNRAAGRSLTIVMDAGAAIRTITLPAQWYHNGSTDTISLPAAARLVLTLYCSGTEESDVSAGRLELVT